MSAAHRAEARAPLGWRIATVLGVIFGIYILAQDLDWQSKLAGLTQPGDIGVATRFVGQDTQPGQMRVTAVTPGSSAAAAGIVAGDTLGFDPAWQAFSTPRVGEHLVVTVLHGGARRRTVLTAGASHAPTLSGDPSGQAFADLADLPAVLLGLLILVRGRSRPAPVLLGAGLIAFGMDVATPSPVLGGLSTFLPVYWINDFDLLFLFSAFLAFALVLLESAAGARRWRWFAYWGFTVALATAWLLSALGSLGLHPPFEAWTLRHRPFESLSLVSLAATLIVLLAAWWRTEAGGKPRIALLAAAFTCILVNQAWFQALGVVVGPQFIEDLGGWPTLAVDVLAGVIAPVLFAYAILKHRVLDLGFALNRTLVYSGVSAIMLGAFGLIEWGFDHFVKIHGRGENALIDAGIALGVYLAFHRVTGVVEHVVETLFFHRWREKEAALRRFVADAAFVTRPDALAAAFTGAAARFADVAGAAVYLVEAGGCRRAEGAVAGLAETLDADDPALVRARAEHRPVEPDAVGSRLAAGLVCPMVQRNEVIGLLVLAPRAEGQAFRPDEIELIGWATLQVGLDLHALEIERLEAAVVRLEHQLEGARLVTGVA